MVILGLSSWESTISLSQHLWAWTFWGLVPCNSFKFLWRESRRLGSFETEKVMLHHLAFRKCYIWDILLYTCHTITCENHFKCFGYSVSHVTSSVLLFFSLNIYLRTHGCNPHSYEFSVFLWASSFHLKIYENSSSKYTRM